MGKTGKKFKSNRVTPSVASQLGMLQQNRVGGEQISKKDEILLREAEAEFKRKGRFSLIFPANGTNSYRSYFEEPRNINTLLYKRCLERNIFAQLKEQDRE